WYDCTYAYDPFRKHARLLRAFAAAVSRTSAPRGLAVANATFVEGVRMKARTFTDLANACNNRVNDGGRALRATWASMPSRNQHANALLDTWRIAVTVKARQLRVALPAWVRAAGDSSAVYKI